ncbi:hypothetical protein Tco_0885111 [Tanacetum coccineum]
MGPPVNQIIPLIFGSVSSTPPSYSRGTSTRPSYSPGSSRSVQNLGKAECSNCKFLAEKIKTLEAKIKILEGALEMEMYPEIHTLDSAAILHELYNDMGKLGKNMVVYVNEAGQATMNVDESDNGNVRVNVDVTSTLNVEHHVHVLGNEAPTGNWADVAISLEFVRAISECFANSVYGFFLRKCVNGLFFFKFSSKNGMYAMLENGPWLILWVKFHDVLVTAFSEDDLSAFETKLEFKDTIVVVVPKLVGERFSMYTIHIEYEWKHLRCSSCKVGPKLGFKPAKQVYQPVSKKNGASTSGKKKQVGLPRQEVSNSSPFDALNSVENDDDLGKDGGNSKLAEKGSNSGVVSYSDSEVEEVFNETDGFMASKTLNSGSGSGFGINSLLEQWKETTVDDCYDPYNDDVYDGHDINCDDWVIKVRGRKKK